MKEFAFDRWYSDYFGVHADCAYIPGLNKSYSEYKNLLHKNGWNILGDNSIVFMLDSENLIVPPSQSSNYITDRKYPTNNTKNVWTLEEKSELLSAYAKWVKEQVNVHGRTEEDILFMMKKMNDF